MEESLEDNPRSFFAETKASHSEFAKAPMMYSRLSAGDRSFLEQLGSAPALGSLSVQQERERMRQGQVHAHEDSLVAIEEFVTSACRVHIVRPIHAKETPLPIIFYLHGGGWVLGDLQTHMKLVCSLAVQSSCAVAFVDYPRAPEHPFPAPMQACAAAIEETLAAADLLSLYPDQFILAGDSSGGNLVMAVTQVFRKKELPSPGGLVLLYPVTDHSMDTASYREFGANPNLSQYAMQWFWNHYLPDRASRSDFLASPLRATPDVFAGFPSTLVVTCEYDILCDEGEQLAALLTSADVQVTAVRWLGALHGFLVTEQLSDSVSARRCMGLIADFCREVGSQKS
jgi:acetyl esterase/lipase